jgi:hypothetical protein
VLGGEHDPLIIEDEKIKKTQEDRRKENEER